jgi:hypothetical protein
VNALAVIVIAIAANAIWFKSKKHFLKYMMKLLDYWSEWNMVISKYSFPLPNNGDRYDLSQNELVEKEQPKVSINITEKPNFDQIEARISKYRQFAKKKEK